jgi:hypothetical protein
VFAINAIAKRFLTYGNQQQCAKETGIKHQHHRHGNGLLVQKSENEIKFKMGIDRTNYVITNRIHDVMREQNVKDSRQRLFSAKKTSMSAGSGLCLNTPPQNNYPGHFFFSSVFFVNVVGHVSQLIYDSVSSFQKELGSSRLALHFYKNLIEVSAENGSKRVI